MTTRKLSKAQVSKKRDVHTYAELWHGSKVLFNPRSQAPAWERKITAQAQLGLNIINQY
jgi:hypothetical protein